MRNKRLLKVGCEFNECLIINEKRVIFIVQWPVETRKMCLGEWPFIIQTRCRLICSQKSTTVVFLQVRLGRLGTGYLVTLGCE